MKQKRIILLHGWGASTKKFSSLKKELENNGWEVLAPELPGFDAPEPDRPWDLTDYSKYVFKQAEKKWGKKKFVIFGHSFGGRIAIKAAQSKQEKLDGIVLCAAGGISRGHIVKRTVLFIISKIGKLLLFYEPIAVLFRSLIYKIAREHDYEKSSAIMKQIMQNIINEDLKPVVSNIEIDTLILWGKQDQVTPYKDALFIKRAMKGSKLVTFPGQGHKLPYIKYEQIAMEIDKWR